MQKPNNDILFPLGFLAILALWYVIVTLWHPTVSIMVDPAFYHPALWFISLGALAIPLALYLTDRHYKSLPRNRRILLLGIALLTTTMVHSLRCFIDTQFIFFLTTILFIILERKERNFHYRKPPCEYWFVLAYILWNLISLAWTPDLAYGFKYSRNFIPMVAYPLLFLAFTLTADERNALLKLYWRVALMAVLLSCLSGIYEITVLGAPLSELVHLRITMLKDTFFSTDGSEVFTFNMLYAWSGNAHPSYNAIWAVAASVTGFFLIKRRIIGWIEYLFGSFALLALQFSAQSRIGILMLILSFFAAGVYLLWPRRKLIFATLSIIIIAFILLFTARPDLFFAYHNDAARSVIWNTSIDFIAHKPILGSGIGGTTQAYITSVLGYPWPSLDQGNVYAHNQFIGDWMQSGVVGFLLSILMVISTFVLAVRRRSYTAFIFALAILLLMFIEMPLRFIQGTTLITLFLSLFLSTHQKP